ncbi:putative dithiol-disulfide oxidoreductase (DUF899 family) [Hephaestia caeni]|uniref:Putative dithiol-disulfide oxidoreductase (DUF899 family) n=1 Tax=Hephaestia caeni TaxID=645617 RepID=A0A397NPZ6_9SPHN|nr:DUF899 family protein [Hephaestia caeni]RIA36845.1 putative dithiol-disulfide oxidoreductase (DUF899 family) [Hephaestia caeni]
MASDPVHLAYPNESAGYREARNELLDAEIDLRRRIEHVAALRRALPPGGAPPQDYVFERTDAHGRPEQVKLSELFEDHPTIILYSFMYGPERDLPCNGCTHILDALDGTARHANQVLPLYIVARSPLVRLEAWGRVRGWRFFRFLSAEGNSYTSDYFGNTTGVSDAMRTERGYQPGENWDQPVFNVFTKRDGTVRHSWGTELVYVAEEPGQNHRAVDMVDPLWNLLDMTPEGRGTDWFPKVWYD